MNIIFGTSLLIKGAMQLQPVALTMNLSCMYVDRMHKVHLIYNVVYQDKDNCPYGSVFNWEYPLSEILLYKIQTSHCKNKITRLIQGIVEIVI